MTYDDFKIRDTFVCGDSYWLVTDIGTRTIIAIKLDHDEDHSWYDGPPYAVMEVVFDEYDLAGCSKIVLDKDIIK